MKKVLIITGILALLATMQTAFAQECNSDCQLQQVNSYFLALDKVSRKGSTAEDIEALLSLTHDDVKYIHVEYEANFTKETWRKAFLRNLAKDSYQHTDKNQIQILQSIAGKNHLAVEYSHGVIQPDGQWKKSKQKLVLFGFTDGKLSLIKELW